jgi:hypothetical protein
LEIHLGFAAALALVLYEWGRRGFLAPLQELRACRTRLTKFTSNEREPPTVPGTQPQIASILDLWLKLKREGRPTASFLKDTLACIEGSEVTISQNLSLWSQLYSKWLFVLTIGCVLVITFPTSEGHPDLFAVCGLTSISLFGALRLALPRGWFFHFQISQEGLHYLAAVHRDHPWQPVQKVFRELRIQELRHGVSRRHQRLTLVRALAAERFSQERDRIRCVEEWLPLAELLMLGPMLAIFVLRVN